MRDRGKPHLVALEDHQLWSEISDVVEQIYALLHKLPEDERWETQPKLRMSASDLLFTASQAVGAAGPTGSEYDWGNVRRHLMALKAMYRFAGRQQFIELEPEMMVKINDLIKGVDAEVTQAYQRRDEHDRAELDRLQERYKLTKDAE